MFAKTKMVLVVTLSLFDPVETKVPLDSKLYEHEHAIVNWTDPVMYYKQIISNTDLLQTNLDTEK